MFIALIELNVKQDSNVQFAARTALDIMLRPQLKQIAWYPYWIKSCWICCYFLSGYFVITYTWPEAYIFLLVLETAQEGTTRPSECDLELLANKCCTLTFVFPPKLSSHKRGPIILLIKGCLSEFDAHHRPEANHNAAPEHSLREEKPQYAMFSLLPH